MHKTVIAGVGLLLVYQQTQIMKKQAEIMQTQNKILLQQQQLNEEQFKYSKAVNFINVVDSYAKIGSSLTEVQKYYYNTIAGDPEAWENRVQAGSEGIREELSKLDEHRRNILNFYRKYVTLKKSNLIDPDCDRRFPGIKQLKNFQHNWYLDKANCILNLPTCKWDTDAPREYAHVEEFIKKKVEEKQKEDERYKKQLRLFPNYDRKEII